jgi:hypothetical protein
MGRRVLTALTSTMLLAGCAEVHMRMPAAPPESMEEAMLTGMGHEEIGRFSLAEVNGTFVRGSGAYKEHSKTEYESDGRFTASGGDVEGRLSADCAAYAAEIGESISITTAPFSFRCTFERNGAPIDARLELNERKVGLSQREGLIFFRGRRIDLKSSHKIQETRFSTGLPAGYTFLVDGQEIGGIDLNGADKRVYLPRDPAYREAAIAASVALSLLREPDTMFVDDLDGRD